MKNTKNDTPMTYSAHTTLYSRCRLFSSLGNNDWGTRRMLINENYYYHDSLWLMHKLFYFRQNVYQLNIMWVLCIIQYPNPQTNTENRIYITLLRPFNTTARRLNETIRIINREFLLKPKKDTPSLSFWSFVLKTLSSNAT